MSVIVYIENKMLTCLIRTLVLNRKSTFNKVCSVTVQVQEEHFCKPVVLTSVTQCACGHLLFFCQLKRSQQNFLIVVPFLFCLPFSKAPDNMSLKAWRAEANMGLRRFSEALCDLEDLCCARPQWAEVKTCFQKKVIFACQ